MPCGKTTCALVGSWGTQVEFQAVSDCFNVTVFVYSPNPSGIVGEKGDATTITLTPLLYVSLQAIYPPIHPQSY